MHACFRLLQKKEQRRHHHHDDDDDSFIPTGWGGGLTALPLGVDPARTVIMKSKKHMEGPALRGRRQTPCCRSVWVESFLVVGVVCGAYSRGREGSLLRNRRSRRVRACCYWYSCVEYTTTTTGSSTCYQYYCVYYSGLSTLLGLDVHRLSPRPFCRVCGFFVIQTRALTPSS